MTGWCCKIAAKSLSLSFQLQISILMKVLLDIKDDKAAFIIELLHSLKYVKTTPLTPDAAEILAGLEKAIEEVNQIKMGKKKARSLSKFLNEV